MKKQSPLEERIAEELLLAEHNVLTAITGSLECVQKTLQLAYDKDRKEIACGEIGHTYLLVGAIEHHEHTKLEQIRKVLDFYRKQIYTQEYKRK